ncbi:hypothetical protein TNCV_2702701 [Trichonephila clavipes]|nr:hypothetical protein TNCV_2702701 [Trichonephila clavipes]
MLLSTTKKHEAIEDGLRNFEPLSSNKDDIQLQSPVAGNLTLETWPITSVGILCADRFNVQHRSSMDIGANSKPLYYVRLGMAIYYAVYRCNYRVENCDFRLKDNVVLLSFSDSNRSIALRYTFNE